MSSFQIVQTRPEQGGTGVIYYVEKLQEDTETKKCIVGTRGYLFVPDGQNVEATVEGFLRSSGWLS